MIPPPFPPDEKERLAALEALHILDSAKEEVFEVVVRLAQQIFQIRMAGVSFVDRRRQWFKNIVPDFPRETSREISFAGHVLGEDPLLVVEDTLLDPRFADNPHVTSSPNVRFYAGCAIRTPQGHAVGALSIMDTKPRSMSSDEKEALKELAAMVESEIKHRLEPHLLDAGNYTELPGIIGTDRSIYPEKTLRPEFFSNGAIFPLAAAPKTAPPGLLDEESLRRIVEDSNVSPFYLARVLDTFLGQCEAMTGALHSNGDTPLNLQIPNLAAGAAQIGADKLAAECLAWSPQSSTRTLEDCLAQTTRKLRDFIDGLPVDS